MIFGAPRRRELVIKKEKYENIAVITVSEFKGKGTGRTITLNKKAIESLGLDFDKEPQVSFSFDGMKQTVSVANTTGLKNVSEVKVAKTSKSVSDKAYYEAIKANFGVKIEDSVELKLIDNNEDFNGFKTFKLEKLEATDVVESTVAEAVAETEVQTTPLEDLPTIDAEEAQDPTAGLEAIQEEDPLAGLAELEEAPIEHIQELAEERDVFEQVSESAQETEAVTAEVDSDNPFLNLED
jgi:hypothetical protein